MRGFLSAGLVLLAACSPSQLDMPPGFLATPGPGSIRLTWEDTAGEAGFKLYRQLVTEAQDPEPFELLTELEADITQYEDKEVELGAAYLYRLSAVAGSRESGFAETPEALSPKPETMELTLVWRGAGGGEVSSDPALVACTPQDGECSFAIPTDSEIVLEVKPNASSVFAGWGGACEGTEPSCTLTMDTEKRVEVSLNEAKRLLKVSKLGDGAGTIRSTNIQGLECAQDCTETEASFVLGNIIALEAVAEPGSAFRTWGGACTGQSCSVTLDEDKAVTATFVSVPAPVIETFTASDTTILRGESVQLSWTVTPTADTTLRLEPDNGDPLTVTGRSSEFVTPTQTTTYKLVASNTSGEANEALVITVEPAFELEVAVIGNENGKIVGNGINCGNLCVNIYKEGETVTLRATDDAPFERWGAGCDAVRGDECDVLMNASKSIIAYFSE